MYASARPTATLNVFVKNVGSSGTIPAGWAFTMYNPSYVSQSGFWNLKVGKVMFRGAAGVTVNGPQRRPLPVYQWQGYV